MGLGNVYYAQREDEKALICFETVLESNHQNVVVMTMVGNIYRRRKEFDRALDKYAGALEIDSENNFALFGMGDCYRGQGDMDQAVHWWDKILAHEPENQALWTRVGDALGRLGRFKDAEKHYNASLLNGFDLYAVLGLARINHQQGCLDVAIKYCEDALKSDKDNPRVLEELSKIHEDAGNVEEAKAIRARIE